MLGGRSPVIYVVKPAADGKGMVAEAIPVVLGVADGSWIQVTGAVQAGQSVVRKGNERLRPGAAVKIVDEP